MCGICGIWYSDGRQVAERDISAMAAALAHRGPDGQGTYRDRDLALGHRRLAILDLTPAGEQPMSYGGGRYWITFNGEIYNFLELRAELEARGYGFRSDSDTEVILAAYAAWGPECLSRFNGMWAFGIWDHERRELFLARDRFGIKPLFYSTRGGRFAFASEIKAFLALDRFAAEVNWPVFKAELLDLHTQEGGENTLFQDVHRLRPGHYAVVREGHVQCVRWWHTLDHLVEPPKRFEDQVARFRELFEDACRLRMRSDVPIGTSLSGGADSSSVVATVAHVARKGDARTAPDWQRAFVATFPGSAVDERQYAEIVVASTGVQAIYREITPAAALAALERSVFHLEQLEAAPLSQLLLLYAGQREHGVVVTLDGHGGDELLAGYPGHVIPALYDAGAPLGSPRRYIDLLRTYRAMVGTAVDAGPSTGMAALAWDTSTWLRNTRRAAGRVGLAIGPKPFSNNGAVPARWLSGDLAHMPAAEPAPADPVDSRSLFRKYLYRHFHETELQVILRNYDRLSMAHGVEVRMPLMDWRLVTYAFSLPSTSLLGHGYSKLILRRAMAGLVPDEILERRAKIGFAAPMSAWLAGPWRAWANDTLNAPDFLDNGLWDGRAIRTYVASQPAWDWRSWSSVWRIIHAHMWLRCFTSPAQGKLTGRL
jgi:asparagine synthase (glutamine-hydrolysing)